MFHKFTIIFQISSAQLVNIILVKFIKKNNEFAAVAIPQIY